MPQRIKYWMLFLPLYIITGISLYLLPLYAVISIFILLFIAQAIMQEYTIYIPYGAIEEQINKTIPINITNGLNIKKINIHTQWNNEQQDTNIILNIEGEWNPYKSITIPYTAEIHTKFYLHRANQTIRIQKINIDNIKLQNLPINTQYINIPQKYQDIMSQHLNVFDIYTLPNIMHHIITNITLGEKYIHIHIQPQKFFQKNKKITQQSTIK